MPEFYRGLTDQYGRPIEKKLLTEEVAAATVAGLRTPMTGYPGDGLTPVRLAALLKEADQGYPIRQLELAETIEERDPHLIGVLGTRRRSVSQLDITVDAASDDDRHEAHAEMLRDWLKRDELQQDLFDMLDAIHKGYSFTEILWDTSMGQWQPARLEWRDPRWFDFDRRDLTTPQLIDEGGRRAPLPGFKFIYNRMSAKSGIPTRSGLSRVTAWAWMFKAFSMRDWAIFSQTYGQPIRVGKYGQGASKADKDALFRAVANVAGDMAAMIPQSMAIDFVQASQVGASADLYEKRAKFLDQQLSKAVLGQTATTDAIAGGHAVGQEHREVQEDIEKADAKQLAAAINRDLVKPWIDLEFGPQEAYPHVRIGRPDPIDVKRVVETARAFRLPIKKADAYNLIGLGAPGQGDEIVVIAGEPRAAIEGAPAPEEREETETGLQARQQRIPTEEEQPALANDLAADATDALLDAIGDIVRKAESFDEIRGSLMQMVPDIDKTALRGAMRQALVLAQLTGRRDLLDGE